MDRQKIMGKIAEYFGLEADEETGEFNIDSYEWDAGCYTNGRNEWGEKTWMSLGEFVRCIEQQFSDCFYDYN